MSDNIVFINRGATIDAEKQKELDAANSIATVEAAFFEKIANYDGCEVEELRACLQEAEIAARRWALRLSIDFGLIEGLGSEETDEGSDFDALDSQ
ncbi:MAG: hypothetical protein AAGB04_25405 [Pseudomonadota bacterium]